MRQRGGHVLETGAVRIFYTEFVNSTENHQTSDYFCLSQPWFHSSNF